PCRPERPCANKINRVLGQPQIAFELDTTRLESARLLVVLNCYIQLRSANATSFMITGLLPAARLGELALGIGTFSISLDLLHKNLLGLRRHPSAVGAKAWPDSRSGGGDRISDTRGPSLPDLSPGSGPPAS